MTEARDFWSRRRAEVAAEEQATQAAQDAHLQAEQHAALEEKCDADILVELNLPDPDQMKQGDDFSVFMAKAVPDRIRRRALRTLWRSNPVLANVDQLVDYGEDFTDGAMVIENLQTAYQVGKGMLKHVEEMARQAEEDQSTPDLSDDIPETDSQPDPVLTAAAPEVTPTSEPAPALTPEDEAEPATQVPRRMKFRIEETA